MTDLINYSAEEAKSMREIDFMDTRNVSDRFKGMDTEVIKSILDAESSPMVLCLSNQIRDMNLGAAIRNANGFNINSVVIAGKKSYDRRGTVGSHNYKDVTHQDDIFEVIESYRSRAYRIVAAEYDTTRMQYNLQDYQWNFKTLLIMGEESRGLEPEILDAVDEIVYCPMYGSVRSFNVAVTAGIFMYDYNNKLGY